MGKLLPSLAEAAGVFRASLFKCRRTLKSARIMKNEPCWDLTFATEGDILDWMELAVIALGFSAAELLIEFGYPTQRFILRKEGLEEHR